MIPQNNLGYPIRISTSNTNLGSGFFLRTEQDIVYLVTAKHVLFNEKTNTFHDNEIVISGGKYDKNQKNIDVFRLDLNQCKENSLIKISKTNDLIIIKFGHYNETKMDILSANQESFSGFPSVTLVYLNGNIKLMEQLIVSTDVYQYGFPTSLGIQSPEIEIHTPLVRKGIISALYWDKKLIIIDCEAHYGNSGGPVTVSLLSNMGNNKHFVIGIVSKFIPYSEDYINPRSQLKHTHLLNSGYSVIIPMDQIIGLINEFEKEN